tara:strand:+ start:400 stop:618 length:219 start_codon:yes stop_codon:yes gene_type:complete
MMKSKLDNWGYKYEVIDIQKYESARAFIVLNQGLKTVPQLFYGNTHINPNIDTENYTLEILEEHIGHLDDIK